MNFQSITRLRRSMSALWTTRRFVREDTRAFKFVARDVVRHSLQSAGVEGAGDSITSVCAAVEERREVHRRDRAVFFHTGLDMHQHRMPAAMTIKNFFARQCALHRPAGNHRQFAYYHFMIERIALPTETPAVRSGDHANMACGNFEHLR